MYSIACTLPTGNKNEERVNPSPKGGGEKKGRRGKRDKGRKRKRDKREEGIKKDVSMTHLF